MQYSTRTGGYLGGDSGRSGARAARSHDGTQEGQGPRGSERRWSCVSPSVIRAVLVLVVVVAVESLVRGEGGCR